MNLKVRYMSDFAIEFDANYLLTDYARKSGRDIKIPVPVEDILENHLHLTLEMDDLCTRFDKPDVLGALYIDSKKVMVDTSLDPTIYDSKLGRFRFTLGHEIGHWRLHAHLLKFRANMRRLFEDGDPVPAVICRERQKREPIEIQADRFAAFLLMPRDLVFRAWKDKYGSLKSIVMETEYEAATGQRRNLFHKAGEPDPFTDFETKMVRKIAREFASQFEVSVEAMQIRLRTMRLLVQSREPHLALVPVRT